jgi:hypothetical protein
MRTWLLTGTILLVLPAAVIVFPASAQAQHTPAIHAGVSNDIPGSPPPPPQPVQSTRLKVTDTAGLIVSGASTPGLRTWTEGGGINGRI